MFLDSKSQYHTMVTFLPNPINSLGEGRDIKDDKRIAHKCKMLFCKQSLPHTTTPQDKDRTSKIVYFVLASDNLVKIGHSGNVDKRMNAFKILHPNFRLLGTVANIPERVVHKVFANFRINNTEWFRYDDSMIQYITANS